MSGVLIVTNSRELAQSCERALRGHRVRAHVLDALPEEELLETLRKQAETATGVNDGNIHTDAVILDGEFSCFDGASFVITQPLFDEQPAGANSILNTLIGAGIPVLVVGEQLAARAAHRVGECGAEFLEEGGIRQQVERVIRDVPFNRDTFKIENEFAARYDIEELGGAATVSAILNENEFVISELRELVKERTTGLRVLDLGCGTGRFEELILTDPKIRPYIEEIVAVDFAPRYLVEARKRLAHFLPPAELEKVTFLRRVAENLHLPKEGFDVVLASFGVVCFSRSHLTLQQVAHVTKKGGLTIFNGYNRSALTYEFDAKVARTGDPVTNFAIHIDKKKNVMHLGPNVIDCMTFDVDAFESLLRLVGLNPRTERSRTFPTFYGAVRSDYLNELPTSVVATAARHSSCHKPGERCAMHLSYQDENLVLHNESPFNDLVHKMDADLERVLEHQGFYFSVAAFKGPVPG